MLIKVVAAILLAALLWTLLRFALGLRWAKLSREAARRAEEEQGRHVVADLPLPDGEVVLLLEDGEAFRWGPASARKEAIRGARLLLNGGVLAECAEREFRLPPLPVPEEFEGRERWEVVVYLVDGGVTRIPCGTLREGVSRETAHRAFGAVRAEIEVRG